MLETMVSKPEQVIAVDLNPAQLALFDLKLACIKVLEYDEIDAIFHKLNHHVLAKHLPKLMKSFRSSESIVFWKEHGAEYLNCLYNKGASGMGMKVTQLIIQCLTGIDINIMINTPELVPQLWQKEWREEMKNMLNYLWHTPFCWTSLTTPIKFALGVPPRQSSLRGNLVESPEALLLYMDRVFASKDFKNNTEFFAGQFGNYGEEKPFWLERENVEILRSQVHKCHLRKGYFTEVLRSLPDNTADCFLLSDHMDWMSQQEILEEWEQILRVSGGKGEVMWRTAGLDEIAYPHCLSTLTFANQTRCDEFLAQEDRLPSYRHHHIILDDQDPITLYPREDVVPYRSPYTDCVNLYQIMSKAIRGKVLQLSGNSITNWSEFFYEGQAATYDSFRHMMLHGRFPLMNILPLKPKTIWADIGCGTGFNLEYVKEWIVTDECEHIYLLDFSRSMLDQAQKRVDALGVAHKTTLVECDCSQ